jgi:hypothetical protein
MPVPVMELIDRVGGLVMRENQPLSRNVEKLFPFSVEVNTDMAFFPLVGLVKNAVPVQSRCSVAPPFIGAATARRHDSGASRRLQPGGAAADAGTNATPIRANRF